MLFDEAALLDRYRVFGFIYFIDVRKILLYHLQYLYRIYKKDLRVDFIPLSFEDSDVELDVIKSEFFQKKIKRLQQIPLDWNNHANQYSVDTFLLRDMNENSEKRKLQKYRETFVELSNYIFQYFKRNQTPIGAIDKMLRSLTFGHSNTLHALPVVTSALFHYLLDGLQ